jgi:hypothetical protein
MLQGVVDLWIHNTTNLHEAVMQENSVAKKLQRPLHISPKTPPGGMYTVPWNYILWLPRTTDHMYCSTPSIPVYNIPLNQEV